MSDFRVASRYAKSLFYLAVEEKLEDEMKKDMELISAVCSESRGLVVMLKNPIIKYDKKLSILKKIFESHVNQMVARFFALLARKNRANILPEIADIWLNLYNEHKKIVKANIISAISLTDAERDKIKKMVAEHTKKQEVQLDEVVDQSLIGGFILRIGDEQVDHSLSGKLNTLRRNFHKKL